MYAVDVVDGLMKMDDSTLISRFPQQSHRFRHVFGCDFKASTYGDQKRRWKRATEEQRQAVLDGGRTPLGLWSVIVSNVPLKQ
jgi:hypothetical protein